MELDHFALSLKNQQLFANLNDSTFKSLQDELLNFIGGIRTLLKLALNNHCNFSHQQHQQLFNILHSAAKRAKASKTKDLIQSDINQSDAKTEPFTLQSLNETCLSYLFTFLNPNSHRMLQRSCINLYIAGSVRTAFLSNTNQVKAGYFPHLIHHINIVKHYNGLPSESINALETNKVMNSIDSMSGTLSMSSLMPVILLQSGYSNPLIALALNTKNIDVLRVTIACISFLTENKSKWRLNHGQLFQLIKRAFASLQITQSDTLRNCINITGDIIHSNSSLRLVAINSGILDGLLQGLERWNRKVVIVSGLNLLFLLIPKKGDICVSEISNENMVRKILNIVIKYIKLFTKWTCDENWKHIQYINAILLAFSQILWFIHDNYWKIDFAALNIQDNIDKIFEIAIFGSTSVEMNMTNLINSKFHETMLLFIKMDWGLVNRHQNVIRRAIQHDIKRTFVPDLFGLAVKHSKERLSQLYDQHSQLMRLWLSLSAFSPALALILFPLKQLNGTVKALVIHAMAAANDKQLLEFINNGKEVSKSVEHICGNCAKSKGIKRCSRCKRVYYCSQECQASHWNIHKKVCKVKHCTNVNIVRLLGMFENEMRSLTFKPSDYVTIISKIISICNNSQNSEERKCILMDCKAAVCGFWKTDSFLSYLSRDEWVTGTVIASCISDILQKSLVCGEDIYQLFLAQNVFITEKILDVSKNKCVEIFWGFLYELCIKCDAKMIRKLIEIGIGEYLKTLLSNPEKLHWSRLREILKSVTRLLEVDSEQIMLKMTNLKQLLTDANFYDDIDCRETIKKLIGNYELN